MPDGPGGEDPAGGAREESPIEGQVLLATAAKASVPGERVPELARIAQAHLGPRLADYRRRYELVHETPEACYFLVPGEHWATVGGELGCNDREADALRRAHEEQLLRAGRREDRREEFEAALDIRAAVVIGR